MKNAKQDRPSVNSTGKKDGHDGKNMPGKHKQSGGSADQDPDYGEDPDKKIQIDDNPEETKRKIPRMG